MADRYERMTTAQLEEEAAGRSPAVDLSSASTNPERARLLRADDEIHGTPAVQDAEPKAEEVEAPPEPEAETVAEPEAGGDGGPIGQSPDSATNPLEPAPYNDPDDLANRQAAAAGTTEYTQQPEGEVPPVGGQDQ